jgi:hypothetical protein
MTRWQTDRGLAERIRVERRAADADTWDEVWDGLDVRMPMPTVEHQRLTGKLTTILTRVVDGPGLGVESATPWNWSADATRPTSPPCRRPWSP